MNKEGINDLKRMFHRKMGGDKWRRLLNKAKELLDEIEK